MVHKSSIIPGVSNFIDTTVLSHYPPTSMKRILASGAIALYLNQNGNVVDTLLQNPMIAALNLSDDRGMVDIDTLRDIYKNEISKVGFMRLHIPILGDVDFTSDDVDTLHKSIMSMDATSTSATLSNNSIGGI